MNPIEERIKRSKDLIQSILDNAMRDIERELGNLYQDAFDFGYEAAKRAIEKGED